MVGMAPDPNPGAGAPDGGGAARALAEDEAELARHAAVLADGIEAALPGWVERSVARVLEAWSGTVDEGHEAVLADARTAGSEAAEVVGPKVRDLLALPPEEQWTNPLSLLRPAAAWPTAVLRAAGVPPVVRDQVAEAQLPDDDYDLAPTTFADLDPALHEPGLVWGAAKAHVFLRHRREAGQR